MPDLAWLDWRARWASLQSHSFLLCHHSLCTFEALSGSTAWWHLLPSLFFFFHTAQEAKHGSCAPPRQSVQGKDQRFLPCRGAPFLLLTPTPPVRPLLAASGLQLPSVVPRSKEGITSSRADDVATPMRSPKRCGRCCQRGDDVQAAVREVTAGIASTREAGHRSIWNRDSTAGKRSGLNCRFSSHLFCALLVGLDSPLISGPLPRDSGPPTATRHPTA